MAYLMIDSPIGELTLVHDGSALTGLYFPHHWTRPDRDAFGRQAEFGSGDIARQFTEYFAGERTGFDVPIRPDGDEFQHAVWERISAIPYGETVTYGDIAAAIGRPRMAREVGAAVGSNPLSLLIPCHRVVGKNGKVTGYAGGLKRKQFLLDLERQEGRLW